MIFLCRVWNDNVPLSCWTNSQCADWTFNLAFLLADVIRSHHLHFKAGQHKRVHFEVTWPKQTTVVATWTTIHLSRWWMMRDVEYMMEYRERGCVRTHSLRDTDPPWAQGRFVRELQLKALVAWVSRKETHWYSLHNVTQCSAVLPVH